MKTTKVTVLSLLFTLILALVPRLGHGAAGDIVTVAGGGTGDNGAATLASLLYPSGVAVDGAGNLYVADSGNNRIGKIAAGTGIITTVAGNGTGGHSGDNGAATAATLYGPAGVAIDGDGDLYIADQYNNCVRKVSAATGIITTVAGNGAAGYSGDGGAATTASLNGPTGVAIDAGGNIYVADRGNNRIRKISAETGTITTVAGTGAKAFSGDGGQATSASLNRPFGVAVDAAGDLYISDQGNNRIRKVSAETGLIAVVAGNGAHGSSGDKASAAAATFLGPAGLALDGAGNLYVADQFNDRIRKISLRTGTIKDVAGNANLYDGEEYPAATAATLAYPSGVAVDSSGKVYVADTGNNCVRAFDDDGSEEEAGKGAAAIASATTTAPATTATPLATASAAVTAAAVPAGSYIYDSFTSSTTVTLENHVGETGSSWKRIGGSGDAWIDPAYGAMYTKSDVTFANLGSIPTGDYSVFATVHCFSTIGGNSGVNGRVSPSGAPSRFFAIFTQGLGWGLYYADGYGTETRFGSLYGPTKLTPGRDYKVELRMKGTSISMYVDGVLAASGTSSKNTTYARAGFETAGYGAAKGYELLDFQVAALTSGTTTYTLTYTAGPNGTISGATSQTVSSGGSGTTVTAVANSGYHFVSWSDGLTTASRTDTNVTKNISVTASFAINTSTTYTLTYTAGPGGTISGSARQTVTSGGSGTTVTAVANTGYHFVSWSDGLTTASRTDTNVTKNISVTASFAINTSTTYTLTYTAGPGGTISGSATQTVTSGGSGTAVTAVPNTGYQFVSWSDGVTTATRTDTNVTSNISVTANFTTSSDTQVTYIYDSFTSGSTAALETHTGETGSTWTRVGGSGSAYIDPAYGGVYSSTSVVYGNTGTIPTADYSVIATIRAFSPAGGTNIGVNGRLAASGAPSRYLAVFTQGLGWGLYYSNGLGTLTRIGALYGSTSLTAGQLYTLELRMIGSTVSMYVNGVLAGSGSSTANSAAGRAGIEIAGAGAGGAFEMLDFRVTSPGP